MTRTEHFKAKSKKKISDVKMKSESKKERFLKSEESLL